jgi:uncharacterized membrane protein
MIASFLIGLVGGQRAMTPLATVALAGARGQLPEDSGAPALLSHPIVAGGALLLAVAEMAGDKQPSAPDRVVPIGLVGRFTTSAIAGMALAPRERRWLGAAVGGATALAAGYLGWRARCAAMERFGQTATGFVEDAAVLGGAAAALRAAR